MSQDTRIALCLMGQLVVALRANDPDTFKQWLAGGGSTRPWRTRSRRIDARRMVHGAAINAG